jgi:hypothetical protein
MGGLAIPAFLKKRREGKQYLLLGVPLIRDTERMVLTEIVYGSREDRGWVVAEKPSRKETRFCERMGFEVIDADVPTFLKHLGE